MGLCDAGHQRPVSRGYEGTGYVNSLWTFVTRTVPKWESERRERIFTTETPRHREYRIKTSLCLCVSVVNSAFLAARLRKEGLSVVRLLQVGDDEFVRLQDRRAAAPTLTRSAASHSMRTTSDQKRQSSKIVKAMDSRRLWGMWKEKPLVSKPKRKYPGSSTHPAIRNQAPGGPELCIFRPIKYKRHGSELPMASE